jgi:hypothetical protein
MKTELDGVAANAHAAASMNGGTMDAAILAAVIADNNAKHNTDSVTITYGMMMATAAGPVGDDTSGIDRVSSVATSTSPNVYYLKATSTLVDGRYVVYFFEDTASFSKGISDVPKNRIDAGGTDAAVVPGATASPSPTPSSTASPSATASPTVTPTPTATPTPTPTPAPTPPSIVSAADIVAYDANGELWNYGTGTPSVSTRKSIGASGATIPVDFFVTDWNSDGVQDLVLKMADGILTLRKGLPNGGFTDSQIGSGWSGYEITIGKWKNADPYPTILAKVINTGDLYLYPNAYGTTVGSANRTKIFTAWGDYAPLNLADWDLDGNMDLIGRSAANELVVFRTNGSGSFLSATGQSIGGNWTFGHIRAISGRAGAGTTGFMARDSAGTLFYYPMLDSAWGTRTAVGGGWSPYKIAGN